MTDVNAVREKYASMPDSELIQFTKEEGHQLTIESIKLLKDEFIKRKLNYSVIEETENSGFSSFENAIKITGENDPDKFSKTAWFYAFEQKENGKNKAEIVAGLVETGTSEPDALMIVSLMENKAKQLLKTADAVKITGGFIFVSGIAITFLPLSIASNRLTYIFAWCAILFGAGRFINGSYNKSRYKKIISNISAENNL